MNAENKGGKLRTIKRAIQLLLLTTLITACSLTSCTVQKTLPKDISHYFRTSVWKVETQAGSGSAYFIAKNYLLTNAHVVAGATEITVHNKAQTLSYPATVISSDSDIDLALLHINADDYYPYIAQISDRIPKPGDELFGIGYGLGTPQAHKGFAQEQISEITFLADFVTYPGDSGSPAVSHGKRGIVIQGTRSAVASYPIGISYIGYVTQMLTQMSIVISGPTIREFLRRSLPTTGCAVNPFIEVEA